ncbi:MAG: hypothetical protein FWH01_10135 [Oscillospiraceae bacterium]|nr:hypothetical protein [Oscillospiraceae bacterium]
MNGAAESGTVVKFKQKLMFVGALLTRAEITAPDAVKKRDDHPVRVHFRPTAICGCTGDFSSGELFVI